MYKLQVQAKNYLWGRIGTNSLVGQLLHVDTNDNEPYAELWMGTHTSGMSHIENIPLVTWLQDNRLNDIPFLFKVLSINKALSIQAHPDKQLAEQLFKNKPEHYKDDNHKPEMCIALTEFEALCKFRPLSQIVNNLNTVSCFRQLFTDETVRDFVDTPSKDTLKVLWSEFVSLGRVECNIVNDGSDITNVVLRLAEQYPGDFGVFAPYFLNYIKMKPGDAIFIGANEPHAYISGNCIECMAKSDNVVRAGLTSKYIDTETLCNMLTYEPANINEIITNGKQVSGYCKEYIPPISEFRITNINLPINKHEVWSTKSIQILVVIEGDGLLKCDAQELVICKGDVILLEPEKNIIVRARSNNTLNVYCAWY